MKWCRTPTTLTVKGLEQARTSDEGNEEDASYVEDEDLEAAEAEDFALGMEDDEEDVDDAWEDADDVELLGEFDLNGEVRAVYGTAG